MQNSAFTQGCQYFNCTEKRDTEECKLFHVMLKYNNNEKEVPHFWPARSTGYNITPDVVSNCTEEEARKPFWFRPQRKTVDMFFF